MHRLVIALAIVVMGCGMEADDRGRNLDYITEAVLKPSCGTAACHSTFRQAKGLVFDTIDGARQTFQSDDLLILPGPSERDSRDATPALVINLTTELANKPRMPLYEPLPDADVTLIRRWLHDGAAGTCTGTVACLGTLIVPCMADQAYNLDLVLPSIDDTQVTDCSQLDTATTRGICRNQACVEVPQ